MKRATVYLFVFCSLLMATIFNPNIAYAQEEIRNLSISTQYPSIVTELGESVNISIKLSVENEPETIDLTMRKIPEGWSATFRGGGKIINAVHLEPGAPTTVDLRLDPPEEAKAGKLEFVVSATSSSGNEDLPIQIMYREKLPASLSFETDLPTIKGSPTTTFRYNTTLKNEGDQELTINLSADVPKGFLAKYKVSGQEVNSFPLEANQSKTINIELNPIIEVSAGSYPFTIYANGGELQTQLNLVAEVTGQHDLTITGLDGRLSAKANAGKESSVQLLLKNNGSAPAQGVELNASVPSGWTATFDPEQIAEINAGEQMEITAILQPSDKAIAGDYMITIKARSVDGGTESVDFRITVTTSTLWGIAGVGLIAVAVIVVALAVGRFGRR